MSFARLVVITSLVMSFSVEILTNALMVPMVALVIPIVTTKILSSVVAQLLGSPDVLARLVITTQVTGVTQSTVMLDLSFIPMEITVLILTNVRMVSVVVLSTVSILKDLTTVSHAHWDTPRVVTSASMSTSVQMELLPVEVRAPVSTPRVHMSVTVTEVTPSKIQETLCAQFRASMSHAESSIVSTVTSAQTVHTCVWKQIQL